MGQAAGGDILAQEAVLGVAIGLITKKPSKGKGSSGKDSTNSVSDKNSSGSGKKEQ